MIYLAVVIAVSTAVGLWSARRFGIGADRLARRLLDFLLWVTVPVVAFFNLAALELSVPVGAGLLFAYVGHLGAMGLAWAVGTHVLHLPRPSVGALMLVAGLSNTGFLGLPFVIALFGVEQLPIAVIYDVSVSLVLLVTVGFSIGAAFGTAADRPRDRVISFFARNPPLYATGAGLLAPAALAPDWAVNASQVLVLLSVPVGFFALGVVLVGEATATSRFLPATSPPVAVAVALKLAVPPLVVGLLSASLVAVPPAYVSQAAMAAGIQTLVVSSTYGLDRALTAAAIAWSTALVVAVGLVVALLA